MAVLDINRVWFKLHSSLDLGMFLRSYSLIITDKTFNKSLHKLCLQQFTVDFNSLWPRRCGNILGTWELHVGSRFYGFIVIDGNEIANFETKTMSLILKFDLKFANFTSKFEVY